MSTRSRPKSWHRRGDSGSDSGSGSGGDSGSVTVEMVILAPVLIVVVMLFIVFLGRATGAVEQIRHAADVGARAASLVARSNMESIATDAAMADLSANGVNCSSTSVSATITNAPGASSVTVTVTCAVNAAGTTLLGASARVVAASSTEVIDRYRRG